MDFWHESAMPHNVLCMYPDLRQGFSASGTCTSTAKFAGAPEDEPEDF